MNRTSPGGRGPTTPAPRPAPDPQRTAAFATGREAARTFAARYGQPPAAVAFAPGRVNLIGEHLDYCGLPVLPAALRHGVALAFRPREDDRLRCVSAAFADEPADFRVGADDFRTGAPAPPGFARYLAAAATGLRAGGWVGAPPRGWDGALASSLPPASGLSSSSAVVVAAALALLAANDRLSPTAGLSPNDGLTTGGALPPAERRRLAADLAAAESGVAIRGGAMDQSVCLGAVAGHALRISPDPPAWTPVPLPAARFAFLAAFSGRRAEKGEAGGPAQLRYNARVVEAAAALAEAGRALGGRGRPAALLAEHSPGELLRVARGLARPLDRRLRHLVTETRRVGEAVRCLEEEDPERFGALLDASHASLRDDYEVSTPELDALVREARRGGALGARLTGAGLGGSAVVLSTPEARPALRAHLETRFYTPRGLTAPDGSHLLDADPAGPAALLPLSTG